MNVSFLQELLNSIAEQGRHLLPRSLGGAGREDGIEELATALVSSRGEASGVAIAGEILRRYRELAPGERLGFLEFLARTMQPDAAEVTRAAKALPVQPGHHHDHRAAARRGKPPPGILPPLEPGARRHG